MAHSSKKKINHRTKLFLEFFSKELGVKFVDVDTGEEILDGEDTRQ